MSNIPVNNNQTEEIDLGFLIHKINQLFKKAVVTFFQIITFYLNYKFIVLALIIMGVAYGYYKDATSKPVFKNEAIVIPNFESVDYLYDKVEALNAKITSKDTVYLKTILDTNYRKVRKIEIEPIIDIYNFAAQSRENIDIFRILFQNQELSYFVEDITTSKYYKYHRLNFVIRGEDQSPLIVKQLLTYFNDNEHFADYQKIYSENTAFQIKQNTSIIAQVDSLIQSTISFSKKTNGNQSVSINDNSDLGNLMFRKQEALNARIDLLKQEKDIIQPIKEVSLNFNLPTDKGFILRNKVKYPIIFILIFSLIFYLRYLYKKLEAIAKSN